MASSYTTPAALNTTKIQVQVQPRITTITFDAFFLLVSLWILTSILYYGFAHRKFSGPEKSARVLFISATCCAVANCVYLVTKITSYNLGFSVATADACDAVTKLSVQMYGVATSSVYLFLWFRQRSLYSTSLLEALYKSWVKASSYMSISFMLSSLNIAGVVFNGINHFTSSAYGCERVLPFYTWPFLVASAINALGQSMLLFLFVYPFRFARDKPNTGASVRLLKRSLAVTLLCISTDMVTGLFNTFVPYSVYRTPFIAYGWSATMNLIGVVFTFQTWREILFFSLLRRKKEPSVIQQSP